MSAPDRRSRPGRPGRSQTSTSVSNSHTEGRTGREKGTTS
ncbi:hypothetical protein HMPREF1129_1589 [Actinomyces naeslundii str. Howell 279]|uniref:Uncharacterized protein n=1 Tax=Actinomyces naeslundii (strain ATCC 12104 / DSM 43013 / CCUG 2238 / JCM 8349 / NCTC 10301 / Howell 279) TaxID=1115803 RepID=J3JL52_ACTNH|nr:hypothetical protein HMPREF1129_1589 [Actinomyces naeslundii str. Howell 279]